jgi:hypothetical protein
MSRFQGFTISQNEDGFFWQEGGLFRHDRRVVAQTLPTGTPSPIGLGNSTAKTSLKTRHRLTRHGGHSHEPGRETPRKECRMARLERPPAPAAIRTNFFTFETRRVGPGFGANENKREADHIDGYDRDDLGLSPDFLGAICMTQFHEQHWRIAIGALKPRKNTPGEVLEARATTIKLLDEAKKAFAKRYPARKDFSMMFYKFERILDLPRTLSWRADSARAFIKFCEGEMTHFPGWDIEGILFSRDKGG